MDNTSKYLIFFALGAAIATASGIAVYINLTEGNYKVQTLEHDHDYLTEEDLGVILTDFRKISNERYVIQEEFDELQTNFTKNKQSTASALYDVAVKLEKKTVTTSFGDQGTVTVPIGQTSQPNPTSAFSENIFQVKVVTDYRDDFIAIQGILPMNIEAEEAYIQWYDSNGNEFGGKLELRQNANGKFFSNTFWKNLGERGDEISVILTQGAYRQVFAYTIPELP